MIHRKYGGMQCKSPYFWENITIGMVYIIFFNSTAFIIIVWCQLTLHTNTGDQLCLLWSQSYHPFIFIFLEIDTADGYFLSLTILRVEYRAMIKEILAHVNFYHDIFLGILKINWLSKINWYKPAVEQQDQ